MKLLFLLLSLLASSICWAVGASPCPVTVGTLTLDVYQPRTSCISPCLLFFDTTGSPNFLNSSVHHTSDTGTLSGQGNVIQDVYYTWAYGDPNASGTGTWPYGSRPNQNSKNQSTGPVGAHLYVLPTNGTTDLTTNVEVWAYDGTNIATCTVSVTVFSPSGTNGFTGTNTICAFNSTVGTGCPTGASTVTASTLTAATASIGSGKRILLKCGDSFSGQATAIGSSMSKISIGAYGGCENTATNRPKLTNTANSRTIEITGVATAGGGASDVRVMDLDFEDGTGNGQSITVGYDAARTYASQVTIYNVNCTGTSYCWNTEGTQVGAIGVTVTNQNGTSQYFNVGGSTCLNAAQSGVVFCGASSYDQSNYANVSYQAALGNSFDVGTTQAGRAENTRFSAGRMIVFANNTLSHVAGGDSLLKMHNGHIPQSDNLTVFDGQNMEIAEVSDNLFINGPNNGYDTNYCPQNQAYNEHLRYGIFERNVHYLNNAEAVGPLISATNTTLRNNVVYAAVTGPTDFLAYCYYATHQGGEPANQPGTLEIYNNTCYAPTSSSRFQTACVQTDANGGNLIQNNLCYNVGGAIPVAASPTGNTISNNSANSTTNFNPQNHSTTFQNITDFKPGATVSGGTCSAANFFDATGLSTIGACTFIGALSPAAPAP